MKHTIKYITILTLSILLGNSAIADQFKTVSIDQESDDYSFHISYPEFFSNSAPAFRKINQQVKDMLVEYGCGEGPEQGQPGFYYEAHARVVGLNRRYIGLEIGMSMYCGGAHPNHGTYNMTYDAKTGEPLHIGSEFGLFPWDHPERNDGKVEAIHKKFAVIIAKQIDSSTDEKGCYADMSQAEIVEMFEMWYPGPSGLARGKQVVLSISPPHVAGACQISVRVNYNQVKHLLSKNSFLHRWLK